MDEIVACLEAGGGVVIAKMKSRKERKLAKRALKQAGAVESKLGIWKKPKQMFGAALPPPVQQAESEEEDYGPSLEATRKPSSSAAGNSAMQQQQQEPNSIRGEWMTSNLQATDPRLLLRQKAQTSQKSRTFSNVKGSSPAVGEVDSREIATGRADPSTKLFTPQANIAVEEEKPFRFNHAEVMGTGNDVDTSRLRNELQNGIASRFTQSKKFL